jgi:hypothetical protein
MTVSVDDRSAGIAPNDRGQRSRDAGADYFALSTDSSHHFERLAVGVRAGAL